MQTPARSASGSGRIHARPYRRRCRRCWYETRPAAVRRPIGSRRRNTAHPDRPRRCVAAGAATTEQSAASRQPEVSRRAVARLPRLRAPGCRDAAGLLAQDRHACSGELRHQWQMQRARCRDQHAIDLACTQQRCHVGIDEHIAFQRRRAMPPMVPPRRPRERGRSRTARACGCGPSVRHPPQPSRNIVSHQIAVGLSRGRRSRCAPTTAWHKAMSRSASVAEVSG